MPRYSLILSGDDLARVRLLRSPDPLEEMIFAAHLMMPVLRNDPILGGWTRRTVKSLGVAGRDVLALLDSAFVQISDLGHTNKGVVRTFDDVIESVRSLPPSGWGVEVALAANLGVHSSFGRSLAVRQDGAIDHLEKALRAFHEAAIAPYWPQIEVSAAAGSDAVARRMADGGVDHLLRNLHPMVTWQAPALSIDIGSAHPPECVHRKVSTAGEQAHTYFPEGRGLLLVPSVFFPTPTLQVTAPDETEPFIITFPIRTDWYPVADGQASTRRSGLADLMGTTRAAVLEALFDRPETTSGLARRLNISVASASEHAAVLRATKLVTSVRDGNRVVHQVSSFGYAFLRSTVEPGRMKSQ